jgi:5-methylcytosine-specific restriction endonuclease McrA
MNSKKCSTCKQVKSMDDFAKGNDKNGKAYKCKACTNAYNAEYRKANLDAIQEHQRNAYHADVEANRAKSRGYYQRNKDVLKVRHDSYNAVPANKLRTALLHGQHHVEELGNLAHNITADEQYAYWEANGISKDHCHYCQVHFGALDPVDVTIDHVEAISNGGPHTVENIVPACRSCNSSKRDREIAS